MNIPNKIWRGGVAWLLAAGTLAMSIQGQSASAQTPPSASFADPAFDKVWQRTDLPVAQGKVARTWVWGPEPGKSLQEPFKQGPGGTHQVQYFDKARMEINNPNGDPNDPFYVTNGLLVVEMISGQLQVGANEFEAHDPSSVGIAGDSGSNAPSYAALQGVASVGLPGDQHRAQPIPVGSAMPEAFIGRDGKVIGLAGAGVSTGVAAGSIKSAAYAGETGHNIPDVFWSYMNSQGPVYQNGAYVNAQLFNWVYTFGYPVTEAYWTSIKVGNQTRTVLFQAFQRRILTYSPNNPDGWKVEMGNVGAQYYSWRYEQPVASCTRVPLRGFGRVWANHPSVQTGVGCPAEYGPNGGREVAVNTAYQPFQRGAMLWISPTVQVFPNLLGPTIYAFFDDGTFQQFDDIWKEGQPVSGGETPPPGLYEPVRGFGKVWREGTGARVRERLGWATAQEKGGAGAYQQFQKGEMIWSGTVNKIWALYGTVSNPPYPYPATPVPRTPLRYDVFDDTFSP